MAEEYRSSLNRLKNKAGDGEDPVLVAQRFLNIFRQLHIFDEKRHAEFKAQILALSPDIRGVFGMLPGGQALQEYADDVVREAGGTATIGDTSATSAQDTILSAAMAEAAPSSLPQQSSAPQGQAVPPPQAIPQIIQAGGGKIVADEAFAQTLAQAFAKALQFSDNNKKEDIKELIAAIRESKSTAPAEQTKEMPIQSAGTAPTVATESKLVADEEFAQTLARSFAKALQFSDANKKEDIKELIAAIRESKTTDASPAAISQTVSEQRQVCLSADESFAQMLATSFTQALETANAGKTGEMQELIDAIKGIKFDIPQAVTPTAASAQELPSAGAAPQLNIDGNFAQILAQSFASALEMSNAGHKAEMQELIAAIRESGRAASAPVQGGELLPNPTVLQSQEPLTVIADERFAQSISQSLSTALETFGQNQADGFKELAQAFRESQAEIRPAADADFAAAPISGGTIKVVADENFALTLAKSFSSAIVSSDQKRAAEMEKLMLAVQAGQHQVVYASGETVQPQQSASVFSNDNLVREITEALSNAINSSKSETIELTNAIRESQSELAKILLQNNTQNNASAANNNANTIQINNAPIVLPIDEIVGRVIEAQSGFLKEISRHQTEELSSVISSALKESQELSSRTIVDAIKAFQEENLQLIRTLPVQVREVRVQEVPVQEVRTPVVSIQEKPEEEAPILPEDISLPDTAEEKLPETFAADTTDESKKKKKKKKKKKSKSAEDGLVDPRPIPQFVQDDVTNATEPAGGNAFLDVSLFGDVEDNDINSLLPDVSDNNDDELLSVSNDDGEDNFAGKDISESLNGFSEAAFDNNEEKILPEETEPEEEYEFPEDVAENTDEAAYPQEQESLPDEQETAEEIFEEEPQNEFSEALPDNAAAEEPDLSADTGEAEPEISAPKKAPRNSLFDSINRSIKSSSKSDFDRYIKSEFESAAIEEDEVSGADWGFGMTEEAEPEVSAAEYKGWVSEDEEEGVEGQDWEWEYEENAEVSPTPAVNAEGVEGQDWEWEYEEEPADDSESQDWEWAYEEVSDTESDAQQSAGVTEGQDWEWVYEENYAAFTVYGQEVDVSAPVQLNTNLLSEDGKSNNRRNNQKRLRVKSENGPRLSDEIMIAELQKPEERPQPYAGAADI